MELRHELKERGARPQIIDGLLAKLLSCGGKSIASDLLSLLSDGDEADEGTFSLIHAAESFDDIVYVQALLLAFPRLASSAPRWASIVLMRVLNKEGARVELVRQLRNASVPEKKAIGKVCERINSVNTNFLAKTIPVVLAAS